MYGAVLHRTEKIRRQGVKPCPTRKIGLMYGAVLHRTEKFVGRV